MSYESLVKRFPKILHFKFWRNLLSAVSFLSGLIVVVNLHLDSIPSLVQIVNRSSTDTVWFSGLLHCAHILLLLIYSMVLLFIMTAKASYTDLEVVLPYMISKIDHRSPTANPTTPTQSSHESVFTFTGYSEPLSSSSSAIQVVVIWRSSFFLKVCSYYMNSILQCDWSVMCCMLGLPYYLECSVTRYGREDACEVICVWK